MFRAVTILALAACAADPAPLAVCETVQALRPTQCGATLDFTPINRYEGPFAEREDAVVLIDGRCTGTLIAAVAGPVVITAGHCVGLGARALVAFNVEAEADGEPLVTNGTVIEQSTDPDYALLELDQLPAIAPTPLTAQPSARVASIQHPRGAPKVIAEGDYLDTCGQHVVYGDLDTLVGSSGAGVLTDAGKLVAVHSDGDCDTGGNRGWSMESIVLASPYLEPVDL
jgi:hypothetical protein